MKIVTRQEAKEKGLQKFFTGKPCKRNHLVERYTSNGKCCACTSIYNTTEFAKIYGKAYRDSHKDQSAEYKKIYYSNEINISNKKETDRAYRESNKAKITEYRQLNKESIRKSKQNYRKINAIKINIWNAKRRAYHLNACVSWANQKTIEEIYSQKEEVCKETGILHEVDHIVPLVSEFVCGLHNEFNLQVLSAEENRRKGNRYWPDMSDINDPELILLVKQFKSS